MSFAHYTKGSAKYDIADRRCKASKAIQTLVNLCIQIYVNVICFKFCWCNGSKWFQASRIPSVCCDLLFKRLPWSTRIWGWDMFHLFTKRSASSTTLKKKPWRLYMVDNQWLIIVNSDPHPAEIWGSWLLKLILIGRWWLSRPKTASLRPPFHLSLVNLPTAQLYHGDSASGHHVQITNGTFPGCLRPQRNSAWFWSAIVGPRMRSQDGGPWPKPYCSQ